MIKIVVAEDDVFLREEIMLTFQKKGYSVSGISSFAAAVQEIMDIAPDIVILDVNLPFQSGFEICKSLKMLEPGRIDHSESSGNDHSELIRNNQCTCMAN